MLTLKGEKKGDVEIRTSANKGTGQSEGHLGGRVWNTKDDASTDATFVPRGVGFEAVRRLESEGKGEEYLWPGEEQFRKTTKRSLSDREKLTARILLNRGEELSKYALILVKPNVPLTLTISREGSVEEGSWSKGGSFTLEKITVATPSFESKEITLQTGSSSEIDPRDITVSEKDTLRYLPLNPTYPNTPYTGNAPVKNIERIYPCKENSWQTDNLKEVCYEGTSYSLAILLAKTLLRTILEKLKHSSVLAGRKKYFLEILPRKKE